MHHNHHYWCRLLLSIYLSVCLSVRFLFFVFLLCGKKKGKRKQEILGFDGWIDWIRATTLLIIFFLFYLPTYLPHCCCCQSRCPPRSIVWNFFSICLSIYLPIYLFTMYYVCIYLLWRVITCLSLSCVLFFLSVVLLLLLLLLPLNAPGAPTTTSHVRPWSRLVVRTVHTQSTCMHTSHSVSCKP